MRPEEVDELNPDELWLIVTLEAHAQVNLRTIRGLLPELSVDEVWRKWAAPVQPVETVEGVSADDVLFAEVRGLASLCS